MIIQLRQLNLFTCDYSRETLVCKEEQEAEEEEHTELEQKYR